MMKWIKSHLRTLLMSAAFVVLVVVGSLLVPGFWIGALAVIAIIIGFGIYLGATNA